MGTESAGSRLFSANFSRRGFLAASSVLALGGLAGCASESDNNGTPSGSSGADAGPKEVFEEPSTKLSGDLKILLWSHFVPAHDTWFDPFVQEWGKKVGVNVVVDHVNTAEVTGRLASEIQSGSGHDLVQHISTLSQFEPGVVDLKDVTEEASKRWGQQLELCAKSSMNPNTGKYYAYAPGWVPDPGNYRSSLWSDIGMPDGPKSWDELLQGGSQIKSKKGIQMGIGMSQEIDSNMVGRSLLWSFGGSVQDADERVVLNSPETIEAVEFMAKLFKGTMTDEVFSWNAASNNQGLIAGKLSYIVNSISAWRTAQEQNPEVADDVLFLPALSGPGGQYAAQHVMYNWVVPSFSKNVDAAKEFLLHYTANFAPVTYHSELYDWPAWDSLVPQLSGWLEKDPFGGKPADKLNAFADAVDWSVNIGYPGPANTAIGELYGTFVIPNMYARVAQGKQSAKDSVAQAAKQCEATFAKWRAKGLVGG
jgi:multiple sugar transport system substrate-binding protein